MESGDFSMAANRRSIWVGKGLPSWALYLGCLSRSGRNLALCESSQNWSARRPLWFHETHREYC